MLLPLLEVEPGPMPDIAADSPLCVAPLVKLARALRARLVGDRAFDE
ncbi:hypothetical protein [Cellulomonas sp. KRMCY2]|nr:hypothetical protein [Cellulomonas sp. KRMCY2]